MSSNQKEPQTVVISGVTITTELCECLKALIDFNGDHEKDPKRLLAEVTLFISAEKSMDGTIEQEFYILQRYFLGVLYALEQKKEGVVS